MKRLALSVAATLVIAGAAAVTVTAVASAEDCYGLNALRVCATPQPSNFPSVNPTHSSIEECVHVGATCVPATAPVPTVSPGAGDPVEFNCYVGSETCEEYLDPY